MTFRYKAVGDIIPETPEERRRAEVEAMLRSFERLAARVKELYGDDFFLAPDTASRLNMLRNPSGRK